MRSAILRDRPRRWSPEPQNPAFPCQPNAPFSTMGLKLKFEASSTWYWLSQRSRYYACSPWRISPIGHISESDAGVHRRLRPHNRHDAVNTGWLPVTGIIRPYWHRYDGVKQDSGVGFSSPVWRSFGGRSPAWRAMRRVPKWLSRGQAKTYFRGSTRGWKIEIVWKVVWRTA